MSAFRRRIYRVRRAVARRIDPDVYLNLEEAAQAALTWHALFERVQSGESITVATQTETGEWVLP